MLDIITLWDQVLYIIDKVYDDIVDEIYEGDLWDDNVYFVCNVCIPQKQEGRGNSGVS